MGDDRRKKYVSVDGVTLKRRSEKSLLIVFPDEDASRNPETGYPNNQKWVPLSQIDDDCELKTSGEPGDEGELVLTEWIAEQLKLEHYSEGLE